jgi:hypothetical protein
MSLQQFNEYDDDTEHFAGGEEESEELADDLDEDESMISEEDQTRLDGQDNLPLEIKRRIDMDKRYKETHQIRHLQQVIFVQETEEYDKMMQEASIDPKRSLPFLTKFERSSLIGERAKILEQHRIKGEPRLLKVFLDEVDPSWSPIEIATREVDQKRLPAIIRRRLPSGKQELWKLQDLQFAFYMFEPGQMEYKKPNKTLSVL